MKKKCKNCGNNCEGDFCFRHKPRSPLPKVSRFKSKIDEEKELKNTEESHKMWDFFLSIWKKRPHRSEVSNTPLYGEPLTIYFHHILPKEKYDFAKFDEENIIILTFEEHQKVENDMYFYEQINQKREQLKTKYNL